MAPSEMTSLCSVKLHITSLLTLLLQESTADATNMNNILESIKGKVRPFRSVIIFKRGSNKLIYT